MREIDPRLGGSSAAAPDEYGWPVQYPDDRRDETRVRHYGTTLIGGRARARASERSDPCPLFTTRGPLSFVLLFQQSQFDQNLRKIEVEGRRRRPRPAATPFRDGCFDYFGYFGLEN